MPKPPQRPKHLKRSDYFPKLTKPKHNVTSDQDPHYNCIAFACGITNKKYWPVFDPDFYWPPGLLKAEKIEAFVELFASLGYSECNDGAHVEGTEKIAIYVDGSGAPTHAAKQVGPNRWASKLGNSYDIEHEKDATTGGGYGSIKTYMERKKP